MQGTKACFLENWCVERGIEYTRFDYQGHGSSSGDFVECGITDWREDAIDILDRVCQGSQILVGSSMGLWIATLAALARPARVAALVGIAGAPDFTERLIWRQLDDTMKERLQNGHVWLRPSPYDDGSPYPISYSLVESGRDWLLMTDASAAIESSASVESSVSEGLPASDPSAAPISLDYPVRLLHGTADIDVPWQLSEALLQRIEAPDATLTLIKNADHRLSDESSLALLGLTIEKLQESLV